MNIVLSHVVNSAIAHPRFFGTKFVGGSINGQKPQKHKLLQIFAVAGEIVTYGKISYGLFRYLTEIVESGGVKQ